jgi:regulator of sigma E protease
MEFLTTLFYFIVTIFVLVSVHEFGHFIAARMFGMWVPVYSIGMGKRLFGWNKINGFTFNNLPEEVENKLGANTDYRLSLLPIGGYAKIAGMIDETQTEELKGPPQPWEFRSKSWWKKSIVICAGVILNFLLAGAIFIGIKYSQGKEVWETTTIGYVSQSSLSAKLGVQAGDKIVAVNGATVSDWTAVEHEVFFENIGHDFTLTVDRQGEKKDFAYSNSAFGNLADKPEETEKNFGIVPEGIPGVMINDKPVATEPADKIGLQKGDVITFVNEVPIPNSKALIDNVSANAGKEITIKWKRNGQEMSALVTPNSAGRIGVALQDLPYNGKVRKDEYSFGEAVTVGIDELFTQTRMYIKGIMLLVTGQADPAKNLGGPIKIAQYAGKSAEGGAVAFLTFMAILSLSLAFLNILPIPALDGGHLVIILVEAVLRREISQKLKLRIQQVGVSALLLLMAFMIFNDISGLM